MSQKAVLGALAAAIALAYGGSTWWAGTKIKSSYDTALDELPKQTALVRVINRTYERGFFGAVSTVTLELGCAADAAAKVPAVKPAEGGDEEDEADEAATPFKAMRLTFRDTIRHGPLAGGSLAAATIDSELVLDVKGQAKAEQLRAVVTRLTRHRATAAVWRRRGQRARVERAPAFCAYVDAHARLRRNLQPATSNLGATRWLGATDDAGGLRHDR